MEERKNFGVNIERATKFVEAMRPFVQRLDKEIPERVKLQETKAKEDMDAAQQILLEKINHRFETLIKAEDFDGDDGQVFKQLHAEADIERGDIMKTYLATSPTPDEVILTLIWPGMSKNKTEFEKAILAATLLHKTE